MTRATKILLAIAGLLVLSYPGIAWVTGIAIESRLQHGEQQVLDQVPYLTLVRREYHRGVYRSSEIATYGFRLPVPQAAGAAAGTALPTSATITVVSNIEHGPFPGLRTAALAVVDSTLVAPPALQKELSGVLGSKPLVRVHTAFGLFGGATAELASPAFSLRLPDGSTLAWGGLTGTLAATRGQAAMSGHLSVPRLDFHGAQGGVELAGLEYSGSRREAFDGLYLGTGTLSIERLDGSRARAGGDYSLQRVSITSASKASGEFFDMRLDAAADAARLAGLSLQSIAYSESFEHIHGPPSPP